MKLLKYGWLHRVSEHLQSSRKQFTFKELTEPGNIEETFRLIVIDCLGKSNH